MKARVVASALALLLAAVACAPGTPDLPYSPTGSVPIGATASAIAKVEVVPQADGGAVATGSAARPLTRITPAGVVDTAWGASLPNDCMRISRAVASGAKTLVTCSHLVNGLETWQVWRVTAGGTLDPTFGGGDGIADVPATVNELDVAPLPGGGVFVLGFAALPPSRTFVGPLVKVVFSTAGVAVSTTDFTLPLPFPELSESFEGWFLGVRLEPTPTGVAALERLVARVRNNGIEDAQIRVHHFDAAGAATDDPRLAFSGLSGPNSPIVIEHSTPDFAPLADGRAAVLTRVTTLNTVGGVVTITAYLRMLLADGTNDPTFGGGSAVPLVLADGGRLDPTAVVVAPDGQHLVVAGGPPNAPVTARYDTTTGALDPAYGNAGRAGVALRNAITLARRAGVDQLYVGGTDTADRPAVARIWNHLIP